MALAKEKPLFAKPADIEDDFYGWAFEQAEILRQRRFSESDLPNVIEELEGMARHDRSSLKSSYRLVIMHLLKWQFQNTRRARSWERTIGRERNIIADFEEGNQTLKNEAGDLVLEVYRRAARQAAKETGLEVRALPPDCPYTVEQLRDFDWMPE